MCSLQLYSIMIRPSCVGRVESSYTLARQFIALFKKCSAITILCPLSAPSGLRIYKHTHPISTFAEKQHMQLNNSVTNEWRPSVDHTDPSTPDL